MITVLRYGHRFGRDKRTSTHVGLVARAFGADSFVLIGNDSSPLKSLEKVVDEWGGDFRVSMVKNWRKFLKDFKGIKIHLTMYGMPFQKLMPEIKKHKDLLIFVGAEKVPADVYDLCDYNIAIGNQPHSEIAALAVFLDHFTGPAGNFTGPAGNFTGARLRVEPQKKGKKVLKL